MATVTNRTGTTNFEFLKLDWDLFALYYDRAKYVEDFFVQGNYDKVIEQATKFENEMDTGDIVSEPVVKFPTGNNKSDALISLKIIYQKLKQISIKTGQPIDNEFINPIADE